MKRKELKFCNLLNIDNNIFGSKHNFKNVKHKKKKFRNDCIGMIVKQEKTSNI